jgi:hypothetical protein
MTKWIPKPNEEYWYVNVYNGSVDKMIYWDTLESDNRMIQFGNCFPTQEEAEKALEKVKRIFSSEPSDELGNKNELPKLTAEIFDRPECPTWANYAVVNEVGKGFYFQSEPERTDHTWQIPPDHGIADIGKFDASDWKNSLIKRPKKEKVLPAWCKVGYWVYYFPLAEYAKIEQINDGFVLRFIDGEFITISFKDINNLAQANQYSFNNKELRGLVGKAFTTPSDDVSIATNFDSIRNNICIGFEWFTGDELANSVWQLDGKPCFKLEHLNEKGEWVS